MEESLIYDFIEGARWGKYREKLKKDDESGYLKDELETREKLEATLNEEQIKLLKSYRHTVALCEEYVNFQADIKLLNYGIKIGMQLQKAFDEEEP